MFCILKDAPKMRKLTKKPNKCESCLKEISIYKCPKCLIRYCSLGCYKIHFSLPESCASKLKENSGVTSQENGQNEIKGSEDNQDMTKKNEEIQVTAKEPEDLQKTAKEVEDSLMTAKESEDSQMTVNESEGILRNAKESENGIVNDSISEAREVDISKKTNGNIAEDIERNNSLPEDDIQENVNLKGNGEMNVNKADDIEMNVKECENGKTNCDEVDDGLMNISTTDCGLINVKSLEDGKADVDECENRTKTNVSFLENEERNNNSLTEEKGKSADVKLNADEQQKVVSLSDEEEINSDEVQQRKTVKDRDDQLDVSLADGDRPNANSRRDDPDEQSSKYNLTNVEMTEDQVLPSQLKKLDTSKKLHELLSNQHLRDMLIRLNSSDNISHAIEAAMQEPIFSEYASVCLEVIGDNSTSTEDMFPDR
ncbi:uncharacterized protein DDB_G0290685 isoform X1 [Octopus sinensis]|uniref:Uncharacterized protein DDB_G0290685 isoform X1 n=1 Tax=Octopus sinensis TaxID=2607531 RepID=A0A7E6FPF7_9MOLL|nr:uncharacterized protein DDB_G0290685 isoform X1 [Octopus sinensis]